MDCHEEENHCTCTDIWDVPVVPPSCSEEISVSSSCTSETVADSIMYLIDSVVLTYLLDKTMKEDHTYNSLSGSITFSNP